MLKEFFQNNEPHFLFKQFGLIHNIFISCVIITLILIYLNRHKIATIPVQKSRRFLKIMAIVLLINMLINTFGNLYFQSFDYRKHLPFHLCFIANYLFIYGILFNKDIILKITFFLSFMGPIPAILWPELVSTIDNYNFWQYVISHHVFICLSFFSYYALNYKVRSLDYLKTFILANVLMICMYPFNVMFDMNYIFSTKIPDNVVALYPWLIHFPPMLTLEVTSLVITGLLYKFIVIPRNKELETKDIYKKTIECYNTSE